jgi:hypothetical protein
MDKENRLKARKLFHQLERYEILKDTAQHAKVGQSCLFRTSPKNQVKIQDETLAKLILDYTEKKLLTIEEELSAL